jgi:protochlorophyllide reductase
MFAEIAVGTNHFGHFALNKLLLPSMNRDNGKIVVTASGVHDPESPGELLSCFLGGANTT